MSVQERDSNSNGFNAYATLLTRPNYLAGALLLAYTLNQHSPSTPLIILYTPETMSEHSINALRAEAKHPNTILHPVDHLRLPKSDNDSEHGMVAERFIDTWTKLRVFEVLEIEGKRLGRLCFLDADMMIFRDPTPLIFNAENDAYLSSGDGKRLCATHICVCNLDHDAWAPKTWVPENCAYTHVAGPDSIAEVKSEPETMSEMNTGTFLFHPSSGLSSFVLGAFESTPHSELRKLKFPDQDFLNMVFHGRWSPLSWRTNVLKTWRYWHPKMWRDSEVAILHYIVDKPWAAHVSTSPSGDKIAGYKGDDGETHSWWWAAFAKWSAERSFQNETELLETVKRYVASGEGEDNEEMRAMGGGSQDYAKKWVKSEGEGDGQSKQLDEKDGEDGEDGKRRNPDGRPDLLQGPHGPILRKPMIGERGHGPVVRQR
ncbi:nucleotide-diphospho-sugar transferase [Bimuria novae-zelandiae CBS 107.79]|uniref:Nucleotide-diphospho-sugar transferase n=1 Tax=Bimuria novae-zelandiae CBS 107.79 TaxID=1447943 RepID=A0A6A5VBF1_9PLEO|nr:nucleotide-diphospho-sugar transferase [Bimuria novae-zelandiae CBS 107.79]